MRTTCYVYYGRRPQVQLPVGALFSDLQILSTIRDGVQRTATGFHYRVVYAYPLDPTMAANLDQIAGEIITEEYVPDFNYLLRQIEYPDGRVEYAQYRTDSSPDRTPIALFARPGASQGSGSIVFEGGIVI